jgi:tyrosine-protein kinase
VSEPPGEESVLRDRLSVLGRQKWLLLLPVVVVPLIALVASHGQQRLYQASADVLVNQENPTAAALNLNTTLATPPDRYAATQASLARVGIVAQMAVNAANVPHRTAAGLLANSSVTADPNVDLLRFSVTDPIPAAARRLANVYAEQFTVYRRQLDTAALATAVADARRKLRAIVAAGNSGSPLFLRLSSRERDLEELQTLQAAGSSAVVVGSAGSTSLVQPKMRRNILLGIIVGLALGVALAYLRESLDTRVRSADELRARLGVPLLGQVPRPDRRVAQSQELVTLSEPAGPGTESFRILKNNLEISQLQHRAGSIVVTSTTRNEGKSTTAANLAVILARSGRHVVLIDLDLRRPSIARLFGLGDRPGFTSVAGGARLGDVLNVVDVHPDGATPDAGVLEVVTVGTAAPDPGGFLLSSFVSDALADLARRCDVLLVDTPPVLAVGDAMTVATHADALILVAGVNQVRRATVDETRRVLEACPTPKLGVIATAGEATDRGTRLRGLRDALRRAIDRFGAFPEPGRKNESVEDEGARGGVTGISPNRPRQRVSDV